MNPATEQLASLLSALDKRSLDIARRRMLGEKPETLDAIAASHGVTRERVRQLESALKRRFQEGVDWGPTIAMVSELSWDVASTQWVGEQIPILGVTWPSVSSSTLRMLERTIGGFQTRDGWFARPTIDSQRANARRVARDLGIASPWSPDKLPRVRPDDVDEWLEYVGVGVLLGRVFVGGLSVGDRAWIVLDNRKQAMESLDIAAHLDVKRSLNSIKNALAVDPRFVRIDRDRWELAAWGSAPYVTLRDTIERAVHLAGGSIRLGRLVKELTSKYSVTEKSVIAYASSPPMRTRDGFVELEDQISVSFSKPPERTKFLYRRGDGWCFRITISKEHLRGSGSRVPAALVAAFGMKAGEALSFESALGKQALLTTTRQPTTGSIRRFLRGVSMGDTCLLVFNFDMTFSVEHVETSGLSGLDTAGALCGLKSSPTLEAFAKAIGASDRVSQTRLVELMRERGEYDLAALIDGSSTAPV